jgi:hypothetical protein
MKNRRGRACMPVLIVVACGILVPVAFGLAKEPIHNGDFTWESWRLPIMLFVSGIVGAFVLPFVWIFAIFPGLEWMERQLRPDCYPRRTRFPDPNRKNKTDEDTDDVYDDV